MSQQMTTQPAEAPQKLSAWLAIPEAKSRIGDALGGYLDADVFLAQMVIAMNRDDLKGCTVASQYEAVHFCATLGLLPTYQQVALIPRAGKVSVMPQWQGLKALLERHPDVEEVRPVLVGKDDIFETAGDAPDLEVVEHKYDPLSRRIEKLDDLRGGYAVIRYRDGRVRYHFAPAHYIEKCQKCAQTQNVWKAWFEQQALKTVLRSVYARRVVNIDPMVQGRVQAFLAHEDALLGNDPRVIDAEVTPAVQRLPAASRTSMLAERLSQRSGVPVQRGAEFEEPQSQPRSEPASEEPPPIQERADEPEQGQEPGEQPGEQPPGELSAVEQFHAMWEQVSVRNVKNLRQLYDHFTTVEGFTDEDRAEVQRAFNQLESQLSKAPKPDRQQRLT